MKAISKVVLAAMIGLTLFGCKPADNKSGDSTPAASSEIAIGEFASLTGKEANFGQSSHKGTLMAVEEVNAAGGVLGKKLKLYTEDNQSKSGESATIARKLITRQKVVALLGEVASGRSLDAAPVCQQFKIPMISPSSTNPRVTEMGDYIFRVCFIDPFQGGLIAEFAQKTLKAQKVAILKDAGSAYSVGLAQFFKERYKTSGGTVVVEREFNSADRDFKAQLTAIKAANPDAIFIPCYYTEAALIARQARQLGITIPLFGGDGWEGPELLEIGKEAMEGTYFSTHFSAGDTAPKSQDFVKKFKARWNDTPDSMAALGYDSVMVLVEAMKKAGTTDGPKLRDAIAATKDFQGVTGNTTLDEKRNATKPAVIFVVKDGKLNYVETIKP